MIAFKTKLKLLCLAIFCFILLVSPSIQANTNNITVDVDRVLSDSVKPIGLNINFLQNPINIAASLRYLKVGTLRFPDGVQADNYLFDPENPTVPKVSIQDNNIWQIKSLATNGTWEGELNFDDFINLCRSLEAEPFVVIGIDAIAYTGDAPHATPDEVLKAAVEWVRYANVIKGYDVKYWEIGNENDIERHDSIQVKWTPELYSKTVVKFSQAMKQVDPTIQVGANGMRGMYRDWWAKIMPVIQGDVDFLVTHQYSWIENYQQWKNYVGEYDYNITEALKAINKYNPNLKLNLTETSSFNPGVVHTNNTWKMLHNFEMLGQALKLERIDYIHFWTSRWLETDSYSEDNSSLDINYQITPIGYAVKIWNSFLQKEMVYTSDKLSWIRSWATYDPDNKHLNLLLLNKAEKSRIVTINLNNFYSNQRGYISILSGFTPNSRRIAWERSREITVDNDNIKIELQPLSVTVVSLESS